MRIIGGIHRGRTILSPPESRDGPGPTRPITDRVKESLFNSLMSRNVTGRGAVLDVFAGTGSLGLEALSRGAAFCTFIEQDRRAREMLDRNLQALKLAEQAQVLGVDALSSHWFSVLRQPQYLLAFCDPPYRLVTDPKTVERVHRLLAGLAGRIEKEGLLVLRTPRDAAPAEVEGFDPPQTREYGTQAIHFYEPLPADGSAVASHPTPF